MKSSTTEPFRKAFSRLPEQVQAQAREAYKLFRQNPHHPGLHFKRVHQTRPIYSIRVSLGYRAIGEQEGDEITWFWIGSHAEYDKLISRL
jgi:hypothetical protein